jgi:2,3-dihydroxy-2,3-dihydrophenylpropionate dehydrogenase
MTDTAGSRPRVALVTGGSSGIGLAVVRDFLRHGYAVVSLDSRPPQSVPEADSFLAVVGDVCVPADNERAVEQAVERFGGLDVFIGNAGVHDGGVRIRDRSATELAELVRRVLEVDVLGYILGAQAAASALVESHGCMVFTLSDASFLVQGNGAGIAYAAAKHAGLGVVRHLAADLAPQVRVNAVAPGGVVTGLQAVTGGGSTAAVYADAAPIEAVIREFNPLGVLTTPEELAPLYRFLAEAGAAALTGEILRPDGGLSVR